jgi:hypothetical protein
MRHNESGKMRYRYIFQYVAYNINTSISTYYQPTYTRLCGSGGANADRHLIGPSFLLFYLFYRLRFFLFIS